MENRDEAAAANAAALENDRDAEKRWREASQARADHLAWVAAMALGIAEGQPAWALVPEYGPGHPRAEGAPLIRAAKVLRKNLVASLERERELQQDLARARADLEASERRRDGLNADLASTREVLVRAREGADSARLELTRLEGVLSGHVAVMTSIREAAGLDPADGVSLVVRVGDLRAAAEAAEPDGMSEPESIPCPVAPSFQQVQACSDALNPSRNDPGPRCAEAARCHQVLREKAPALTSLYVELGRVGAPA